jgi:hypothetical protein
MRYFRTAAVRAGHVCCLTLFLGLMNFSSAQARSPERSGGASKVLVSEQPRWLRNPVLKAAQATNTDPAVLLALADNDAGPTRNAKIPSPQGPFQFVEGTWLEVLRRYGRKHGYGAEAKAVRIVRGRPVVSNNAKRERILSLRREQAHP